MQKIIPIIHILSKLGVFFSVLLLVPTFVSYIFLDDAFNAFSHTALVTIIGSCITWLLTRRYQRELRVRDGFTLVFMLWLGFAIVAAMPIYLYFPHMSYIDAFFESMSGLTTTGATVIDSVDTLAPSINFWRHMLNWLGGMGIIVLAVAILPMLGVGGIQLFKAEIPGLDKDSKIAPRISQVAKKLWFTYALSTGVACVALYWAGMSWFDALCHAMSTISLGGFSSHDNSIAYFNSPIIEVIIIFVTIFGAISFVTHLTALSERSVRRYWRDEESRMIMIVMGVSILAASIYLWQQQFYTSFWESLRFTAFNYVSIGLSNGLSNTDFGQWPLFVSLWMYFLANILASSGSMGGGVKNARAIVLAKFSLREMLLLLHPNAVRNVKLNGRTIPERTALAVMGFIFVYFMTLVLFTFIMMATGLDFVSALTAMVACLTNTGQGMGVVGLTSNYGVLSDVQKWLCTIVMLLGRLEIFTVLILFSPPYWKK
ncbi:TrkH family potassium uptake protein [Neisseria montereyensis]|uniref:Trk system potassium uptake protein n=1 Tax=Neisseria montereyensis TaxID=2973938 RepID=A0ABT2F928_9NEIS|nr:potassium transporter TrkG [Neisseria montereyensis]MCS4532691.1 TrkH family potassium uptake protein [Neisseria montereyensis]